MTNLNDQAYTIAYTYGRNSKEYQEFCQENDIEFVALRTNIDNTELEGLVNEQEDFVADCATMRAEAIIKNFKNQDLYYYDYTHYHTDFNRAWALQKNKKAWKELEVCCNTTNLDWLMRDYQSWSRWELKYEAKYVSKYEGI
jgi:hypothetical protein